MPRSRSYLNAFTKAEVHSIAGLSLPMVDYLARHGYLTPTYRGEDLELPATAARGKVRYYSFRDLVIARLIQRIRETGVELSRLKGAMQFLKSDEAWTLGVDPTDPSRALSWLVFDGRELLLKNSADPFLDEIRSGGQRSFAFLFNVEATIEEVRTQLSPSQRGLFTTAIGPMLPRLAGGS